ncbi:MAG: hypothetical protein ACAI44_13270 [Candidatus Sericytochromatia bacterium]
MSKAYRIRIAGVNVNLHLDRSITLNVDLLPILGRERMLELLTEELKKAGAVQQADGRWLIEKTLSEWNFDPQSLQLEVRPKSTEKLDAVEIQLYEEWLGRGFIRKHGEAEDTISIDKQEAERHERIQEALNQELERLSTQHEAQSKRFFDEVLQARQLINQSLKEVYRQAVQEKARSLGNVVSISEQEQGGEFRIRLEIQG